VPATATANTYATWDNATNTYATLEAAPTYGVLEGARLQITRTLPSSGAVSRSRALKLAIGGALSPSGTLPKQATHKFTGALTSAGALLRGVGKKWTGSLVSSGTAAFRRTLLRSWSGTLPSSGTLVLPRQRVLALSGSPLIAGALASVRLLRRSYAGALASSGVVLIGKIFTRSFAGTLGSSGTLARIRQLYRTLAGTLAPTGVFSFRFLQRVFITLEGRLWPFGELRLDVRRAPWPPFSAAPSPGVPLLVSDAKTAGPLLVLVRGGADAPVLTSSPKPAVPAALPSPSPTWPPFHTDAEPR
jgi:hypothetical protein